MTMAKHTGYINVDTLAAMFKIPAWDKVDEYNVDYFCETGHYAYTQALKDGQTEEQAEKAREDAEVEARDELFRKWYDGLMEAAEYLFRKHGLMLKPRRKRDGNRPHEYKIVAYNGWQVAAHQIIETINGVGYFRFDNVRDLVDSGPYGTKRQAVLWHLGWISDYPSVYGTQSAVNIYERTWR